MVLHVVDNRAFSEVEMLRVRSTHGGVMFCTFCYVELLGCLLVATKQLCLLCVVIFGGWLVSINDTATPE